MRRWMILSLLLVAMLPACSAELSGGAAAGEADASVPGADGGPPPGADLAGAPEGGTPAPDGGTGPAPDGPIVAGDAGLLADGGNTPVAVHGKLSVSGNQIVDQAGQPVQLRGMSFGWSNWWGQYWTAQTVSWLVDDWKVQIVRAAMGIEPQGAYLDSPTVEKAKVITVVDEAIARGIYVIIDWHDHNAPNNVAEAKAFFNEMATTYGGHPNVIYEIFNEPEGETWAEIKAYAAQVIPVIRAKAPDSIIVVGTPFWSQDVDQAAADPVPGTNIAYTLHFYAATHKQSLRDKAAKALAQGIALFVTEWGVCEASGTGTLDSAETDVWLAFMDANKLSWANWDIADKAGETCSALMPSSSTTGGWPASSLTAAGTLVRGKLRDYAGFSP